MKSTWGSFVDQITFVRYNSWEDPYNVSECVTNKPCSDLWRRLFIWHDLRINPVILTICPNFPLAFLMTILLLVTYGPLLATHAYVIFI